MCVEIFFLTKSRKYLSNQIITPLLSAIMSFFQNNFQVKQKKLGFLYFMLLLSILYQTTKNDEICIRYRRGHNTAAFCRDRERDLSEEPKSRAWF